MREKKAISPVIGVILMIMITFAAASSYFFWINKIKSSSEQSAQQKTEDLVTSVITEAEIVGEPEYNTLAEEKQCSDSTFIFHIQNTGAKKIKMNKEKIYFRMQNSNGETICSNNLRGSCLTNQSRMYATVYNNTENINSTIYYTINGTSWISLHNTTHKQIYDIDIADGELYYVGNDSQTNSRNSSIYKTCNYQDFVFDGSKDNSGIIYDIEYFKDEIYIGDHEGNISLRSNADWEDVFETNSPVASLEVFGNYLYAGTTNGGIYRTNNSSNWNLEESGVGPITVLFATNSNIYAGDEGGIIWNSSDGTTWNSMYDTGDDAVLSFAEFNDILYASSNNSANGSIYNSSDGSSWSLNKTFAEEQVNRLEVFNNELYATTSNTLGTGDGKIYRYRNGWSNIKTLGNAIYNLKTEPYCSNSKPECVQGCNSDLEPGETRLMEIKISDTDCNIDNVGKSTKYKFKLIFSDETQVEGRFTKKLVDQSNTVTPCGNTYPLCNGFCNNLDPTTEQSCVNTGSECVCQPIEPCDHILPEIMDCSLGTGRPGCEGRTCQPVPGGGRCYCS